MNNNLEQLIRNSLHSASVLNNYINNRDIDEDKVKQLMLINNEYLNSIESLNLLPSHYYNN